MPSPEANYEEDGHAADRGDQGGEQLRCGQFCRENLWNRTDQRKVQVNIRSPEYEQLDG